MSGRCALWNEDASTLFITYDLSVEIDFQFALKHETDMAFFAPVQLNKLGGEFEKAQLFPPIAKHLEASAGHGLMPRQQIENDLAGFYGLLLLCLRLN